MKTRRGYRRPVFAFVAKAYALGLLVVAATAGYWHFENLRAKDLGVDRSIITASPIPDHPSSRPDGPRIN